MPTKNRPEFIRKAVDAILAQDVELELLIKDGGESIKDLLPDDNRILYFHAEDGGITPALNSLLKVSSGNIYCWANDDDVILPGTLKYVEDNIGESQWMYGLILMTNGVSSNIWGKEWDYERLKKENFVPQPAVFWTRKARAEAGEFDETNDLVSDYEYWLRLGSMFTPKFTDRIMAEYTLHKDQITQKISDEQLRQAENVRLKYGLSTR